MSIRVLYAYSAADGDAHIALENASDEMDRQLTTLEHQFTSVSVIGHSHTCAATEIVTAGMFGRPKAGFVVTISTVVDVH